MNHPFCHNRKTVDVVLIRVEERTCMTKPIRLPFLPFTNLCCFSSENRSERMRIKLKDKGGHYTLEHAPVVSHFVR